MRFAAAASTLAFAAVAMAQSNTIIKVGEVNGTMALKFDPPFVNVTEANSTVTFIFDGNPGNHTVAQSTFAKPCEPLEGGFNSGFFFVNSSSGPFGTWTLTITDVNTPIWFYCAQQTPKVHCTAGMVGYRADPHNPTAPSTRPRTGNTFDKFAAQASSAASVVYPSTVLTGSGAFATAAVASTTIPASGSSPSGSGGSASGSGAPSASSTSPSSAGTVKASGLVAFLAAAFGVAML
ncbi:hypothetical protein C8T65DRAFT_708699 [Cerioporus squamosus]|nr:hypothetical protein C8T65DRAFT_708699 [Cerioporus squamosus]